MVGFFLILADTLLYPWSKMRAAGLPKWNGQDCGRPADGRAGRALGGDSVVDNEAGGASGSHHLVDSVQVLDP